MKKLLSEETAALHRWRDEGTALESSASLSLCIWPECFVCGWLRIKSIHYQSIRGQKENQENQENMVPALSYEQTDAATPNIVGPTM